MKNKKMPIVAIALLAIVGVVGGTIAYFTSVKEFPNIFKTDVYKTEIEEFFNPEDGEDWKPGTEVNKDVLVRNKGNVPVAVRVTMTEEWSKDGAVVEKNGKLEDGENVVIKTLASKYENNWIVDEENPNVYYYNTALKTGEEIQFLDSVTLNDKLAETEKICTTTYTYKETAEATETKTTDDLSTLPEGAIRVSEKQECSSDSNGYSGLEYKLTIKVETVQYDAYKEYFNTDIKITE